MVPIQINGAQGTVNPGAGGPHAVTISVSTLSPVSAGNLLVFSFGSIMGGAPPAIMTTPMVSDTLGASWTEAIWLGGGYTAPGGGMWFTMAPSSGSLTVQLQFAETSSDFVNDTVYWNLIIAEYPLTTTPTLQAAEHVSVYGAAGNSPQPVTFTDSASDAVTVTFNGSIGSGGPGSVFFGGLIDLTTGVGTDYLFACGFAAAATCNLPSSTAATFVQEILSGSGFGNMYFWDTAILETCEVNVRGNIDYDQIALDSRHGDGHTVQMFKGSSTQGHAALFDFCANVVDAGGAPAILPPTATLVLDEPLFGDGGHNIKSGTKSGNTNELATVAGTFTAGNLVTTDADGNFVDSGGTGGGGGGGAVSSVFGRTGAVVAVSGDYGVAQVTGAAPLASPALTGTPTAPTAAPGTNTTQIATTAFVEGEIAALGGGAVSSVFGRTGAVVAASGDYSVGQVTGAAPLASPALTGTPTAPTPAAADNSTKLATTAFVEGEIATAVAGLPAAPVTSVFGRTGAVVSASGDYAVGQVTGAAPLSSPTFTGTPAAPTATAGTNTTQLATTAFVHSEIAAAGVPSVPHVTNLLAGDGSGGIADAGLSLASKTGNTTKAVTGTGTYTSGNLLKTDASGNAVDAGIAASSVGTVTHTGGALTADLPVFGAGSADVKVGTKTGNTDQVVTATGTATADRPLLYDASGNAVSGTVQGNTTKVQMASGTTATDAPLLYDASGNAVKGSKRGNTAVVQFADSTANPTTGNFAAFDANGNLKDSGVSPTGGGSGGGLGLFSGLLTIPTTTSSGLTTAWNQAAGFSATNNATGITLTDTATHTGSYLEGIVKAYPGSSYTLTTLFSLPYTGQNFQAIGLCILDTLTGKALTFSAIWAANVSTWNFIVDGWNSPTSHNTTPLGRTNSPHSFMWIRLVDNGTTISFQASSDATWWYVVYSVSKSSSFLGSTGFNYLGAFIESGDTSGGITMGTTIMSWSGA